MYLPMSLIDILLIVEIFSPLILKFTLFHSCRSDLVNIRRSASYPSLPCWQRLASFSCVLCGLLLTSISQVFLVTFLPLSGEDGDPPPPAQPSPRLLQFLVHIDGRLGGRALNMWAN